MKVKKTEIMTVIISIILVHTTLIQRICSLDMFFYVRWFLVIILCGILLCNVNYIHLRNNQFIVCVLVVFAICSIFSSYTNRSGGMLHVGIFNLIFILTLFASMKYISNVGTTEICIDTVFILLFMYCTLNDVFMFVLPGKFMGSGNYILHNKFYIAYLHVVLLAFYGCKKKNNKIFYFIMWVVSIIVCSNMGSSTGITGLVVMFILSHIPYGWYEKLKKPVVAFATMLGCSVILLIKDSILTLAPVQFIVTTLLNETLDLNSRTYIYAVLWKVLQLKPWFGFGAENNFNICQKFLLISRNEAAPDAQNGLADWLISYGRIGTILLIVLIMLCFKKAQQNKNYMLMVGLYIFFVLSSVEIDYDIIFFFLLASYAYLVPENDYVKERYENRKIKMGI